MAARSVRCLLVNQTDSNFNFVSDGHDHGQYTEPWHPPATIEPGATGEWRSESDGFMTGTEGHVRYSTSIFGNSGSHTEFIDVTWNNPFIGRNTADISVVADFTNAPSAALKYAAFIEWGAPPNAVKMTEGDVEAWIDGLLFPPYILANWDTSTNHATAFYGVKAGSPPHFSFPDAPTGPTSYRLNTTTNPAQWAGRWESADVSVTLARQAGKAMTAYVTDRSVDPAVQFQQDFLLGGLTWVADHMLTNAIDTQFAYGSETERRILLTATARAIGTLGAKRGLSAAEAFQAAARVAATEIGVNLSVARTERTGAAISSFVERSRGSLALMNGVYLSLYDVLTGGQKTGGVLDYERHGPSGRLLHLATLNFFVDLH